MYFQIRFSLEAARFVMLQGNPAARMPMEHPTEGSRSVMAQENLKLSVFLFHHQSAPASRSEKVEDKYKDPDMLPKVNKADRVVTMKAIKEFLRSYHGFVRGPPVYFIRKTITVQVYGDYPKCVTPDDEMIARMLHIPPDKKKLHNEQSAQSVTEHTAEYKTDNRTVYDILDQICKDTDLYLYVKQHKSKCNDSF